MAPGDFVLPVSYPGAVAYGCENQEGKAGDGDAERQDDDEGCAREDDLVDRELDAGVVVVFWERCWRRHFVAMMSCC